MHLHSTLLFYFDVPYISATFFWKNDARETVYFSSSYVTNSVFLFAELSPVDEKKERDIESSSLSRKLLQKSASTTALTLLIQPTGECHLCRQNCSKRLLDALIGIYINVKSMAFFDWRFVWFSLHWIWLWLCLYLFIITEIFLFQSPVCLKH